MGVLERTNKNAMKTHDRREISSSCNMFAKLGLFLGRMVRRTHGLAPAMCVDLRRIGGKLPAPRDELLELCRSTPTSAESRRYWT